MKMFCADNFVSSGAEKSRKTRSIAVTLCLIFFYVLTAFTFMNFLYCLSDCIGSIVCGSPDVAIYDAQRSVPIFLTFFITLGALLICQAFYRNESREILSKKVKKHAIAVALTGLANAVYTLTMRFAGRYDSLVEGAPSPLYPLDAVLYSILFSALGVCLLLYFRNYEAKRPYEGVSRPRPRGKCGFVRGIFMGIWLLVSLYGFCGFFYGLFIIDFAHGYLPYSLASMLVSLVAFGSFAVWGLYYNNLKEESRKKLALPTALIYICISLISAALYFVALKFNLDGPSNVGFGLLPIAFSASVNFATILVAVTPVIASLAALLKGLLLRKKK